MENYLKLYKDNNEYNTEKNQNNLLGNVCHIINDIELDYHSYTICIYDVVTVDEPTKLYNEAEHDYLSWDRMSIDGVTLDELTSTYTFNTIGTHIVKYKHKYNPTWGDTGYWFHSGAFENCKELKVVYVFDEVSTFNNAVFSGSGITYINIPNSLKSMGNFMFTSCHNLEYVDIPSSVNSIQYQSMFQDCYNLKGVGLSVITSLPNHFTTNRTFENCKSLISIDLKGDAITSLTMSSFSHCENVISIKVPNSVIDIGGSSDGTDNNRIFQYCSSLRHFNFPPNTRCITNYCFEGCTSLQTTVIPKYVEHLGLYAYSGCSSLISAIFECDNLNTIKRGVFSDCYNLKDVKLPSNLKEIGNVAFFNCRSLVDINLPKSLTLIGSSAFTNCYSLSRIDIPDNVEEINAEAFCGCTNVTEINFGKNSKLKKLNGTGVFRYIWRVKKVIFPESLEYLNKNVLSLEEGPHYNEGQLEYIYVGGNIKEIGEQTFAGITSLKTLVINAITPPLVSTQILRFNGICKIYVPDESLETYKTDPPISTYWIGWSEYAGRIYPMSDIGM